MTKGDERGWVEEEGRMYYDVGYDFIDTGKAVIFMYCSGVQDRNGRKIYEGDFVSYKGEVFRLDWSFVHRDGKWFSCFFFCQNGAPSLPMPTDRGGDMEVVGNKYENPDLVEQFPYLESEKGGVSQRLPKDHPCNKGWVVSKFVFAHPEARTLEEAQRLTRESAERHWKEYWEERSVKDREAERYWKERFAEKAK